jgi:hypothetical protein
MSCNVRADGTYDKAFSLNTLEGSDMQKTRTNAGVFACILVMLVVAGCGQGSSDISKSTGSLLDSVSSEKWKALAGRRIFFAHKSVGYNIVEGITEIEKSEPQIGVRLLESKNPADFERPVFAHAENGMNGDPIGKLAAFRQSMNSGIGDKVDVAAVKFCWADFTEDTKLDELFAEYKKTMTDLKTAYPHVNFVHVTVPLTVTQAGVKALVKSAIGKPVFGLQENAVRNRYNELIRHEYKGHEPLFDLASWESIGPDGSEKKYKVEDAAYNELNHRYNSDSGHLNSDGRQWIAGHFLVFLANLPDVRVGE